MEERGATGVGILTVEAVSLSLSGIDLGFVQTAVDGVRVVEGFVDETCADEDWNSEGY